MNMTNTMKQIESIKTAILDIDVPTHILLAAVAGAQSTLLQRQAVELDQKEVKEVVRV